MNNPSQYVCRELSWLSFNERVLQEAEDKNNPLIERVRFLGIYSNNLDEFYKISYANLKRNSLIQKERGNGEQAKSLLRSIIKKIIPMEVRFEALYNDLLLEMSHNQIFLINEHQLTAEQEQWIKEYYHSTLRALITPIILTAYTDLIQILKDDHTYLAVEIIENDNSSKISELSEQIETKKTQYAIIDLPTDHVSRFIHLPSGSETKNQYYIFLDNIIRFCLPDIFNDFFDAIEYNAYAIKFNRDAEYELNFEQDSLIELMSQGLKQRLTAQPVRLTHQKDMPKALLSILLQKLNLTENDATRSGRYPNLKDLISLPYQGRKILVYPTVTPIVYQRFSQYRNYFDAIKSKDVLLYYPYYTFDHVIELMRQASFDPNVVEIKMNIYRVSKNSTFVQAAINAARNGKKVTVVVELQARFDEEINIRWAKKLASAGVKVIYSLPKLKIHAKLFLIARKEHDELTYYAHIGSGNFNEKTAALYTDFAYLTANQSITEEAKKVFKFLENPFKPVKFNHLLVSPQNTRERLNEMIEHEIINARVNKPAGITLKLNALTDHLLIEKLYEAGEAGVAIKIIVRGMCCMIPMYSNIQIISIVDRYLEHARVYIFEHDGNKETYISSADWMPRNIDNRVEVGVKIEDAELKTIIHNIIDLQLNDTMKARIIDETQSNQFMIRGNKRKLRSQLAIYDYLAEQENSNTVLGYDEKQ